MPDFPEIVVDPPGASISVLDKAVSACADYMHLTRYASNTSGAWPTASLGYAFPIQISQSVTIYQMACYNGATVSGNVDVGIYDSNYNRLVSIGGVAQAGVSALQVFDVADTALPPGDYYFAMVADNITATFFRSANPNLAVLRCLQASQMAAAYPLPATWVPAAIGTNIIPALAAIINPVGF